MKKLLVIGLLLCGLFLFGCTQIIGSIFAKDCGTVQVNSPLSSFIMLHGVPTNECWKDALLECSPAKLTFTSRIEKKECEERGLLGICKKEKVVSVTNSNIVMRVSEKVGDTCKVNVDMDKSAWSNILPEVSACYYENGKFQSCV
ncbi:MAG: hypothetical protein BWY55_00846 [archaeon ADurb.Bin336]|nr:MAG: hypothetical protein BWY55_00846 [archaeon ADurb.Bin336]